MLVTLAVRDLSYYRGTDNSDSLVIDSTVILRENINRFNERASPGTYVWNDGNKVYYVHDVFEEHNLAWASTKPHYKF